MRRQDNTRRGGACQGTEIHGPLMRLEEDQCARALQRPVQVCDAVARKPVVADRSTAGGYLEQVAQLRCACPGIRRVGDRIVFDNAFFHYFAGTVDGDSGVAAAAFAGHQAVGAQIAPFDALQQQRGLASQFILPHHSASGAAQAKGTDISYCRIQVGDADPFDAAVCNPAERLWMGDQHAAGHLGVAADGQVAQGRAVAGEPHRCIGVRCLLKSAGGSDLVHHCNIATTGKVLVGVLLQLQPRVFPALARQGDSGRHLEGGAKGVDPFTELQDPSPQVCQSRDGLLQGRTAGSESGWFEPDAAGFLGGRRL